MMTSVDNALCAHADYGPCDGKPTPFDFRPGSASTDKACAQSNKL